MKKNAVTINDSQKRKRRGADTEEEEEEEEGDESRRLTKDARTLNDFVVYVRGLDGKTITLNLGNEPGYVTFQGRKYAFDAIGANDGEDLFVSRRSDDDELTSLLQKRMRLTKRWSTSFTLKVVKELKNFLTLKANVLDFDACELSPSSLIDEVWHEAILNTRLYRELCESLEHNPEKKTIDHSTAHADCSRQVLQRRRRTKEELEKFDTKAEWDWGIWHDEVEAELEDGFCVEEIMRMIEESAGIKPDQQRLIFKGKQLEQSRKFSDYVKNSQEVLHLVLRLSGC
jgi:hypothetical protein